MRRSSLVTGLAVIGVAAAAFFASHHARAQDSGGFLAGTWEGSLFHVLAPIAGDVNGDRGVVPATLVVEQQGTSIRGTLTLDLGDTESVHNLVGHAGSGIFWLTLDGGGADGSVLIGGKVDGVRAIGEGHRADPKGLSSLQFNLKKVETTGGQ